MNRLEVAASLAGTASIAGIVSHGESPSPVYTKSPDATYSHTLQLNVSPVANTLKLKGFTALLPLNSATETTATVSNTVTPDILVNSAATPTSTPRPELPYTVVVPGVVKDGTPTPEAGEVHTIVVPGVVKDGTATPEATATPTSTPRPELPYTVVVPGVVKDGTPTATPTRDLPYKIIVPPVGPPYHAPSPEATPTPTKNNIPVQQEATNTVLVGGLAGDGTTPTSEHTVVVPGVVRDGELNNKIVVGGVASDGTNSQ